MSSFEIVPIDLFVPHSKKMVRATELGPHHFELPILPLTFLAYYPLSQQNAAHSVHAPRAQDAVLPGNEEQVARELPVANEACSVREPLAAVQFRDEAQPGHELRAGDAVRSVCELQGAV